MVYTLLFFFSSKCSLFHNSNVFGSCIIHILYTGCAKIKKKIRLQKVKHYKHTAQCVNGVRMSANSVRALPQNQQTRHLCAPS